MKPTNKTRRRILRGLVQRFLRMLSRPKYQAFSPDGFPISMNEWDTEEEAMADLKAWCKQFEQQGYYASLDGPIDVADLLEYCTIRRVDDAP